MSKPSKTKAKKIVPPRSTPRLLLAIDPAKAAGAAVFYEGKLVATTVADGSSFRTLKESVSLIVSPFLQVPENERLCLLEQHFIAFHSVKGSLTLGQRRGIAQSVGEALGFSSWEYVDAATWQSYIFNRKRVPDTKAASDAYVLARYGFTPATDDVSDAICLASYFLDEKCLPAVF